MLGKNALQNANTFNWICNFGVSFLICKVELAQFHKVHVGVLRNHYPQVDIHSSLNSSFFQGNDNHHQNSESQNGILQK